jgi:hypothetical protein
MGRSSAHEHAAAVAAELAPYAWREFTDRMLARRVVGAVDRHCVIAFLSSVPGTAVGAADPVTPAEAADVRVDALVRTLEGQLWRGWSLSRLCSDLTSVLRAWHVERESLDADVRRLLEGH